MSRWICLGLVTFLALSFSVVSAGDESLSRVKRIVNGTVTAPVGQPCSWPYAVIVDQICTETFDRPPLRCSGNIVAPGRILTNKYCLTQAFPGGCAPENVIIRVIAGAKTFDDVLEGTRQMRFVSHVLEHPDSALAMLVLQNNLQIVPYEVETIALSQENQTLNDSAWAAGWGTTNVNNAFQFSTDLHDIHLYLRHYELGLLFYSDSVVEVFREQSGVNQGDSGGPIVVYQGNQTMCEDPRLVAVTNCFTPVGNCGHWRQGRHPDVYHYTAWIQEMIVYVPPVVDAAVSQKSGLLLMLVAAVTAMVTSLSHH